jgi:hypothetical protein
MQKVRTPMQNDRKSLTTMVIAGAAGISLLVMMLVAAATRPAAATPKFSQQTSRQCEFCHVRPAVLNERGKNFARTLPLWER